MSTELAQNVAHAGLRAPATSGATSVSVELITGAWPAVPFTALMEDGTSRKEQVSVTGVSGNTLTVTRAQGGTSAVAHDTMSSVDVITTTEDLATLETFLSGDSVAAHAAAADPHTGYVLDAGLTAHDIDTTSVHGIANTAVLATATSVATAVSNHEADTTSVHGITDTAQVALKNAAQTFTLGQTFGANIFLNTDAGRVIFRADQGAELNANGETGVINVWQMFSFDEISDPAAPAGNKARLYCRDNGGGKTQICVRFPTGAVQVIATEP